MRPVDLLRKKIKKVDAAINKALEANCDLAADALAVKPELCGELGTVGRKLREAYEAFDEVIQKYL